MKKTLTLIIGVLFAISLNAQNEQHLYLHHSGAVIYNDAVHNINGITFQGNPTSAVIDATDEQTSFPVTMIDSITFGIEEAPSGDIVRIVYNGNSVESRIRFQMKASAFQIIRPTWWSVPQKQM